MPVYVFSCTVCGPFEESRPMAQAGAAASCPACLRSARRVFTAPNLPVLGAGLRRALAAEEASAHEPRVVGQKQGRPLPRLTAAAPTPPWVMSH